MLVTGQGRQGASQVGGLVTPRTNTCPSTVCTFQRAQQCRSRQHGRKRTHTTRRFASRGRRKPSFSHPCQNINQARSEGKPPRTRVRERRKAAWENPRGLWHPPAGLLPSLDKKCEQHPAGCGPGAMVWEGHRQGGPRSGRATDGEGHGLEGPWTGRPEWGNTTWRAMMWTDAADRLGGRSPAPLRSSPPLRPWPQPSLHPTSTRLGDL